MRKWSVKEGRIERSESRSKIRSRGASIVSLAETGRMSAAILFAAGGRPGRKFRGLPRIGLDVWAEIVSIDTSR